MVFRENINIIPIFGNLNKVLNWQAYIFETNLIGYYFIVFVLFYCICIILLYLYSSNVK